MQLTLHLHQVAAWAPGLDQPKHWQNWATTPFPLRGEGQAGAASIPPMLRRRLDRQGRMALEVASQALGQDRGIPLIFATRHGELRRSHQLLQTLMLGELLSPTDFALSVHNASAGVLTIARQDHSAATALAGGRDLMLMGLIEAYAQLHSGAAEVLLVMVDDELPPLYQADKDEDDEVYALALRLKHTPGAGDITIQLTRQTDAHPQNQGQSWALQWLRWWFSNAETALIFDTTWQVQRVEST